MSELTTSRQQAAIVAGAPAALLASLLWHPYIAGRLPNEAGIAAEVGAGTTRWALAHIAAAVASGLVILAFIAIHSYLRDAGDVRWSTFGLPFIVMGSVLFTLLPGMEFAPLAAVEVGADPGSAQAAVRSWFLAVLVVSAVTFAVGVVGFSKAIADSGILTTPLTWLVVASLIVMAASRLVPFAVAQFYVQGAAALLALWLLAHKMWGQEAGARPAAGAQA